MKKYFSLGLFLLLVVQIFFTLETAQGATNSIPEVIVSSPNDNLIHPKNQNFIITGKVWDAEGEDLTVKATINNITKTVNLTDVPQTEPLSSNFSLLWAWSELAEGIYENIEIVVSDTVDASATESLPYQLVVDKTLPQKPTITANNAWLNQSSSEVTITGGTDSGGSGIAKTEYQLTGATSTGWITYSGPFTISNEGTTSIQSRTTDKAGNISTTEYSVVRLDRTKPTANIPSVVADSATQITVNPNAMDNVNGAGLNVGGAYLYNRDGEELSGWRTGSLVDVGLVSNTQYTYTYKARDASNPVNESNPSTSIPRYTKALDVLDVQITYISTDLMDIVLTNNTPFGELPEHRVEIKEKGAGINGPVVSASDFSVELERRIEGLIANTEYELWVITRNVEQVKNTPVKMIESIHTRALEPSINVNHRDTQELSFDIRNGLPQGKLPEHRIEVKRPGAGVNGANEGVSDFSSVTDARLITGLTAGTEYEVWLITRNADHLENVSLKKINSVYTAPANPTITHITSNPAQLKIESGDNKQLTIQAHWSNEVVEDVTSKVKYTSSNPSIVQVDSQGKVSVSNDAESQNVYITAEYEDKTITVLKSKIEVSVIQPVIGLNVTPKESTVEPNSSIQLRVTALMENGEQEDVTYRSTYSIDRAYRAIVSEQGLITIPEGVTPGNVTATVQYGGQIQYVNLTVTDPPSPEVVDLYAEPGDFVIKPGETQQLLTVATWNSGVIGNVTNEASYSIDRAYRASVNETGLISVPSDAASGVATVTVSYGGKTYDVTFTVEEPTVTSLTLNSTSVTLKPGESHQLFVKANWSDGRQETVTSKVDYKSYRTYRATVDQNGKITVPSNATPGTANLMVSYGGQIKYVIVTIPKPPSITGLKLDSKYLTLRKGEKHQLTVKAIWSDGREEIVTMQSGYSVNRSYRATVTNYGMISIPTTASSGSATVSVNYQGYTATVNITVS
ncbi:OmpL47-type beta-barrel domain-containing protein [Bacillus sp. Marseille-P3661]|uniref:OmpL47-type beta-barrel domain-containing protein n=1 Tax=Bacillus sp. Marseille-P3661 TaxID=1936234 RepID=UPI000C850340|nr:hypothetical protein [Bacillus sp. Marseille-P3661]